MLCVTMIVDKMAINKHGEKEQIHRLSKHAAYMALIGDASFTMMARMLWEIIDTGCTKHARDSYRKQIDEWNSFKVNYENIVTNATKFYENKLTLQNKADEIKKVCIEFGCKRSGTKADMLAEISKTIKTKNDKVLETLASLKKQYDTEPVMPACYITQNMRDMIVERTTKRITASTAKSEYMLSEKELEALGCELRVNPHYRSGPPMRLYKLIDVLDASDKKYGSLLNKKLAKEKRGARTAKAQATKQSNLEHQTASINEDLQTAGVNTQQLFQMSLRAEDEYMRLCSTKNANASILVQMWNRLTQLGVALAGKQCVMRTDSRLCIEYIDNGYGSVDSIVETMCEMKFLFAHTNYKSIRDDIADKMAREMIEYDGYVSWSDINPLASEKAKVKAIEEWAGRTTNPKAFPGLPMRFAKRV